MRVDKLFLYNFRNLQNFCVDFDEGSPRSVLIGRNGVGKTNILEALTSIFRQLDLRAKPEFAYRINYICNGFSIEVEATEFIDTKVTDLIPRFMMTYRLAECENKTENTFNSEELILKEVGEAAFYRQNSNKRILPKHVFGYYSGTSPRFRELFVNHTENYRDELIDGREDTIRPLFLAEDWHSQFVLLAFYAKHDPEIQEFLLDHLGIEGLDSVLFILQEPYWYNPNPPLQVRERGDERYWWAAGTVKRLLGKLHRVALAPMATTERVPVGIKRYKIKEHKYCYLKNASNLGQLAADIDQKELFKQLESMVLSDLLREVRIRFRIKNGVQSLTFADLSEGEQQLLTVLGLLRFTNQDESLFLLDEPDTHLNPAWCLDYLDILTKYGGGLTNSQIIMTTHSPLVFAGLEQSEVIILQRRELEGRIEAEHPASSPKGMGFSAILTSEFFGLRSSLDRKSLDLLDEKRRLGALDQHTPAQKERLLELNQMIKGWDFTQTVNDPLYAQFVQAMTDIEQEEPALGAAVLTVEALEQRRKRAVEALRRAKQNRKT